MHNQKSTPPRVCVLSQAASDVRPYYREFFAGLDLFFVTFKDRNPDAVDFLPGSTWSDGRNRLWEHVKGRYDYYFFIDDDLDFYCLPTDLPTSIGRVLQTQVTLQEKLGVRPITERLFRQFSYHEADPARFRTLLFRDLQAYRPMVATLARTRETDVVGRLDRYALNRSRAARPVGWFDAQATIFSNVGGELLLPYDTHISGWWSSQIPIYCLGHLAFRDQAVCLLNVATQNANHSVYRPGYDGVRDCLTMSEWLSRGILGSACDPLNLPDGSFIDFAFGHDFAKTQARRAPGVPQTLVEALRALQDSFDLHHPYIYERHREAVDALDAESPARPKERVND